jgi:outer membrane protein assembly factor BamA
MNRVILLLTVIILISCQHAAAQKKEKVKKDSVKTGFSFGGVPVVAYDQDVGFKYGIVLNLYHYGDGSRYPLYDHSLYLEWSRTTKGSGINQLIWDTDKLIPKVRTTFEASYLTEQTLDFYGFNGYKAYFDHPLMNKDDAAYLSSGFYRIDRKMLRLRADFVGDIIKDRLNWFAGLEYYNIKVAPVDREKLEMPDATTLYEYYINEWNIIPENQASGGQQTLIKAGAIYDTRDNEPNPMKGIWTEAMLLFAPKGLSNTDYGYTRLAITHRQYFTIIPRDLNFAYRLSYQARLGGTMPFYMLPFVFNSPPWDTKNGLGGAKNIRGVMRNRVVGNDFLYGNLELRWKFVHFQFLKQNVYLALAGFLDGGMVTRDYEVDISDVPQEWMRLFLDRNESLHLGTGAGFHFAMNQNFIITADYGFPLNEQDGPKGALYINLNFLF